MSGASSRSRRGGDIPGKVSVCPATDRLLWPAGKQCAPSGQPNLAGSWGRPTTDFTHRRQPAGWFQGRVQRDAAYSAALRKTLDNEAARNPSIVPHPDVIQRPDIETLDGTILAAPAGSSRSRESSVRKQSSQSVARIRQRDAFVRTRTLDRHGAVLYPRNDELIRQARDHTGYPYGALTYGDAQGGAIAPMAPTEWGGIRAVPGPGDVQRAPHCKIEDGKLNVHPIRFSRQTRRRVVPTVQRNKSGWGPDPFPAAIDFEQQAHEQPWDQRHNWRLAGRKPTKVEVSREQQGNLIGAACATRVSFIPASTEKSVDVQRQVHALQFPN